MVVMVTDVVFSTAHKSKGLEFSTVKVTDDFQVLPNPDSFRECCLSTALTLSLCELLHVCIVICVPCYVCALLHMITIICVHCYMCALTDYLKMYEYCFTQYAIYSVYITKSCLF